MMEHVSVKHVAVLRDHSTTVGPEGHLGRATKNPTSRVTSMRLQSHANTPVQAEQKLSSI